jgi:hypothetical protein
MPLNSCTSRSSRFQWKRIGTALVLIFGLALLMTAASAQTTVSTGSIVGTVTDASGAVVEGAKVAITNTGTAQVINLTSNSSGSYNSGALAPGDYRVRVTQKGFSALDTPVVVQVGNTATVNARLQLGQETQVIEVQGNGLAVNTEQAEVQGVLTSDQIENLPVNGRNFLDLAQLEPGVQISDGQTFDPTKAGYSGISFGGRFGRTARIFVDGVDVSDETVGTTTENIPASAIAEFQLSQSSLDLSNDLTSSGAVNVTTKSGTNAYHGEAFGVFRDHSVGFASSPGGTDPAFQRSQFGGAFGGALIKDKLFFFADGERIKQDSFAPVLLTGPFAPLSGGFTVPFRDNELLGRVDYNLGHGARLFYRYSYFANTLPSDFGLGFAVFDSKNYTRQNVVGADFNTGSFTHTVRFSYLKFQNQIVDATDGNASLPFSSTGATLDGSGQYFGPNPDAPQSTPQADRQFKYDGSKIIHSHILRYGLSVNHIQGGGFASFFGLAPRISWTTNAAAEAFAADSCDPSGPGLGAGSTPCYPGGAANPLNYPAQNLRLGNGLGFNTLQPALGFPAGGLGPDNRLGLYIGDGWKIKPNLTLSFGLRYDRDTGRTDSDLPADANINAAFPGFGNKVNQANLNLAPEFGFAWDPMKNGKTSIRGGVGLYYENVIYNNVLFDRPLRLQTGAFNQTPLACSSGTPQPLQTNTGVLNPTVCQGTVANSMYPGVDYIPAGQAIAGDVALWHQYEAGNPLDLQAPNPNYLGNFLAAGQGVPLGPFGPDYKTPRSVQINLGIQRELHPGLIFSADYLRNVETRTLVGIDVNHVGDVSHFDLGAAQAAIANTLTACGAASVDGAIANCAPLHPTGAPGATMADFADNGLTSDNDFGQACNQALGVTCAFHGINPNQAAGTFLQPEGRSVYNALQMKLIENVASPFRGVKAMNFQLSYSLSSFKNTGGQALGGQASDNDQDFVIPAADNNNPGRYFGPSLLDRTHQISVGGFADLPGKFRVGLIGHFYSPLSQSIVAPNSGLGDGEIFRTDFTGDGTVGDPLPGTHFGQFDRSTNAAGLTNLIDHYNTAVAGQATPAGQVLIQQGLMSLSQLQLLGGVAQPIAAPVPGEVNFAWLHNVDFNLGWRYTLKERFTIEPSIAFFNLFNEANFNLPPNTLNSQLTGEPGSINGTDRAGNEAFRLGNGTGVYALGASRQMEFGLKVTF